jgi:hypothetical protein
MALEHLIEIYKTIPKTDVGTAVGMLESETIPVYSFNKKLDISLNVYLGIEKDINTALDTNIKLIQPNIKPTKSVDVDKPSDIGKKHLFSLEDLHSSKYAPRSRRTQEHEEQLKKNKDISL